jgi:hypothetical protein
VHAAYSWQTDPRLDGLCLCVLYKSWKGPLHFPPTLFKQPGGPRLAFSLFRTDVYPSAHRSITSIAAIAIASLANRAHTHGRSPPPQPTIAGDLGIVSLHSFLFGLFWLPTSPPPGPPDLARLCHPPLINRSTKPIVTPVRLSWVVAVVCPSTSFGLLRVCARKATESNHPSRHRPPTPASPPPTPTCSGATTTQTTEHRVTCSEKKVEASSLFSPTRTDPVCISPPPK